MELFPDYEDQPSTPTPPLADRMRPVSFDEIHGQMHLLGENKPLRKLLERDAALSFILWGPPGSGKTTIARILAKSSQSRFYEISAVNAGVSDIRKVIDEARKSWASSKRRSILFIDEIHRFNKAQQDAVLPHIESGVIRMVGSTTENPSFEVIPALRSRCQIFRLEYLASSDIREILRRAMVDTVRGIGDKTFAINDDALDLIVSYANGDARKALNILEASVSCRDAGEPVQVQTVEGIIQKVSVLYDKNGTEHFDHASAFQKSLRGSDPSAAIYWLAKMIAGGEDPRFIARRLIVTAAEDVGLADPQALILALAAADSIEKLGFPEARIPLAQAVIYIARAPKDNSAIVAIDSALADIQQKGLSFPVPDHLKDSHYSDAKKYGYGVEYKYPHDYPGNIVEQEYLPKELRGRKYLKD